MKKMLPDPSYIESHRKESKGKSYDANYRESPHRRFLWERDQLALSSILETFYQERDIHLLDFACGTGRISGFLESRVATSTGVDVSDEMLREARKKLNKTKLINANILVDNVLQGRKFNLITAFRFFLNAEPELRSAAIKVLASMLDPDSYLVFNNHRNITSPLLKFKNRGGNTALNFMTMQEMYDLADVGGLEIVRIYPVGFFPLLNHRVPAFLKHFIDNTALRISFLTNYSESPIAVCRLREIKSK